MDVECRQAKRWKLCPSSVLLARWRDIARDVAKTLRKLENNLLITSSHHGLVLGIGNHTSVGLASHVEVVLDYRLLIA